MQNAGLCSIIGYAQEVNMNITIFNEYHPNEQGGKAAKTYPGGLHLTLAEIFKNMPDVQIRTATQEEPVHGLTDEVLDSTDVLVWWSKDWHNELLESVSDKVTSRILEGMGAVFLHSGKNSKPFRKLMGTTCSTNPNVRAKEGGEQEKLYVCCPSHPIAEGFPNGYVLPNAEPYCEYFDIPEPDEIVFMGWFDGGSAVRAGVTFRRGAGKIFYFQPGHETYPIYHDEVIRRVLYNAVLWANPTRIAAPAEYAAKAKPSIKSKIMRFLK